MSVNNGEAWESIKIKIAEGIAIVSKFLVLMYGNYQKLCHDRHTVSLLTDHLVFCPKYRGKILIGDIAMVAEGIICKTCVEMDIEIREIAVNPDHVHIFFEYPPKES